MTGPAGPCPAPETALAEIPASETPVSETPAPETPAFPDPQELRRLARELKQQAARLEGLAEASPAEVRRQRPGLEPVDLGAVREQLDAWLRHEAATRRGRLATGLRRACEGLGIELLVLTREPLELRMAPLGVQVDLDADRASITFGREVLETCEAQTEQVVAARARALSALEAEPWDPAAFHRALREAWERAPGEGWKELSDLYPQLVLALQGPRFWKDPSPRNLRPCSRAQVCYDLWRLRRDRALSVDGWRLSLGSATGGSTRDKKRVWWLEDDQGRGQYFLTARFLRDEGADSSEVARG